MLAKRIVGVVTVRNDWAVQSFGYRRYLPLGRPERMVETLDRWGVDEILIQVIDRTSRALGPDLELVTRVAGLGVSTPVTYAGGVRSREDAVTVVRAGADRIGLDALLHTNPDAVRTMADRLGAQALLGIVPVAKDAAGVTRHYDYRSKRFFDGSLATRLVSEGALSEIVVVDCVHEGFTGRFDFELLAMFPEPRVGLVLFGGLDESTLIERAMGDSRVSAICIGNALNYRELALQRVKRSIASPLVRRATYRSEPMG